MKFNITSDENKILFNFECEATDPMVGLLFDAIKPKPCESKALIVEQQTTPVITEHQQEVITPVETINERFEPNQQSQQRRRRRTKAEIELEKNGKLKEETKIEDPNQLDMFSDEIPTIVNIPPVQIEKTIETKQEKNVLHSEIPIIFTTETGHEQKLPTQTTSQIIKEGQNPVIKQKLDPNVESEDRTIMNIKALEIMNEGDDKLNAKVQAIMFIKNLTGLDYLTAKNYCNRLLENEQ